MNLSETILSLLQELVAQADRSDLFRAPICAFSAADDPRYHRLKTTIGPWHCDPTELLPDAKSVISMFVPFTLAVSRSAKAEEPVSALWGEAYWVVNDLFDTVGHKLADFLKEQGFSALLVAATHTYDPEKLQSMWSHRSAAAIAGLGSFGANRMLITEKGSAGRFCTVLTSAMLEPSSFAAPDRCIYHQTGRCLLCIKACPEKALQVEAFAPFVCHDRLLKNAEHLTSIGFCDVCGKCIANCPMAVLE